MDGGSLPYVIAIIAALVLTPVRRRASFQETPEAEAEKAAG
jgi:hypothetical protein